MGAHRRMLVGVALGAGLGVLGNVFLHDSPVLNGFVTWVAEPLGAVFLNLLLMLVVPLLFSALVMGICELDFAHLGRLGLRMLGYTIAVSVIAVSIGLFLVNVVEPGKRMKQEDVAKLLERGTGAQIKAAPRPTPAGFLDELLARNTIKAIANDNLMGLLTFSLVFGLGLSRARAPAAERLKEAIKGLHEVMMDLVDLVLRLAPIGVGALLFVVAARLGAGFIVPILFYVGTVLVGLAIHMVVVYSASVKFLGGMNPVRFFSESKLAIATAFSTSSSAATLPTALKVAEENLKLPRNVSRFVLTAGSAMNQNGTALFEGVTVLFLAQVFNVPMPLEKQAVVMLISILAGIGTAGVPGGSTPVIAMILGLVGIPAQGIALYYGVDRFLDMCRTTLNVTGDLAAAVFVARGEPADAKP